MTSSTAGYNWYKTDTHVHSTVSADAFSDIGIHAAAGKAQGYNAMFLTDHPNASSFLINKLSANHMVFEDTYVGWTTSTFGTQSATTDVLAPARPSRRAPDPSTSPVRRRRTARPVCGPLGAPTSAPVTSS